VPPIPDVPNVLAIQLKLKVGNANVVSRVNARYASPAPTRQQLITYASNVDAAIGTHLLHLCSVQVKTVEIMITDLTTTSSARGIVSSDQQGTRPGLWNGAAVAALINFKVARRYRGGKPRLYLPFFVASDLTEGLVWSEAALAEGTVGWAGFTSSVLADTPPGLTVIEQVNVSQYAGFEIAVDERTGRSRNVNQLRADGPAVDKITGFTINPKLGSQRRRNLHDRRRRTATR
jgi:hypothetical protein